MGGFSPPVPQQDSNWEIRVAVMASLALQGLLIFVGPVRKRSSRPLIHFAVWSCYLLADWVADFALGLILNNVGNFGGNGGGGSSSISHASGLKRGPGGGAPNAGNSGGGNSSPIIFAFWTPFLLVHLGGPDTITAYALEDNELWLRHLIGLLFELFSAFFIFFSSLRGNHMIPATILIFVVGIIKYGERTYSLYSGSINGFCDNILGDPEPGPNYVKFMTEFASKEKAGLPVEIVIADGEAKMAQDALERDLAAWPVETSNKSIEALAYKFFLVFRVLFINLILSYKESKSCQAYFLEHEDRARNAFEVIAVELNFIYDMVYTKAPISHTRAGCVLRFVCSGCLVSALTIFVHRLHKGINISRVDAGVTFALLLGGLVLDSAALAMLLSSSRMLVLLEGSHRFAWLARATRPLRTPMRRWSETTSQLNLVSYCLGKPDKTDGFLAGPRVIRCLAKVAGALRVRDVFSDFFFIQREPLSSRSKGEEPFLLKVFFERMRYAAMEVKNATDEKMKTRSSHRGEGVLEALKESIEESIEGSIEESIKGSIEESIKESIEESIQGSIKESIEESIQASITGSINESIEESTESIQASIQENMESIKESIKEGIQERRKSTQGSIKGIIKGSIKESIKRSIKESIKGSIKESISIKGSIKESIKGNIKVSIKEGIEEGIKVGIKGSIKGSIEGSIEWSIEDRIKDSIKDSIKESIEESIKDKDQGEEEKIKEMFDILVGSVKKREFDESLLLWHIATDLCFLPNPKNPPLQTAHGKDFEDMKSISKTLSEYMLLEIILLFSNLIYLKLVDLVC